jgi:hypothetical protein
MLRRIVDFLEIVLLCFIGNFFIQLYSDTHSIPEYFSFSSNPFSRILCDALLFSTLLLRVLIIVKRLFKRPFKKKTDRILLGVCILLYTIGISFNLVLWLRWYYYTGLYLPIILITSSPIIVWCIALTKK